MYTNKIAQETSVWERRFCIAASCQADTLFVKRRGDHAELWRITEHPDQYEWLVSACEPICPYCGGYLPTQANLDDGI